MKVIWSNCYQSEQPDNGNKQTYYMEVNRKSVTLADSFASFQVKNGVKDGITINKDGTYRFQPSTYIFFTDPGLSSWR